ncbi:MAG: hypothetical protein ACTS9Y_11935 [Methylophilus sp.]|uniref:hypothetical protein n=1 Tax=Methylophilus sp. TaxID=29541 RepID=UPI003FA15FEB
MTLNHHEKNCNDHLDDNQSESTSSQSPRSNRKLTAKTSKKAKSIHSHALDPDIIPPAAVGEEEDIDSEFYPEVYIP